MSVFGRFHAFHLAQQLHTRGLLERLITSYPAFEVERYGVARERVRSLLPLEIARRLSRRLPSTRALPDSAISLSDLYDRVSCRYIPKATDIYTGWSGFSERGIKRAHALRATTILERGSAHIEYQRELLLQENELQGMRGEVPPVHVVQKELREYDLVDYICVPSTFAEKSFIDRGVPAARLLRVPYGVDLSAFQPGRRTDDTFRVVFAGTISLRKGVHYLLDAWARLRLPNAELWLIGAPARETEAILDRRTDSVRYMGHLPQRQLADALGRCSVFALCSIEEGLAMVLPQAMACRLPVVCTANSGGEDILTDGVEGFVIPIRDVEVLMDRLLRLYDDRELRYTMGCAARARVEHGLSWNDYGSRIVQEYERLRGQQACHRN